MGKVRMGATNQKPVTPERPRIDAAARRALRAAQTDAREMVDEREATEHKPDRTGNARIYRGIAVIDAIIDWELEHGAAERRRQRRALELLTAARWALYDELAAAGADEVRQHPTYAGYARLVGRIDRFLAEAAGSEAGR
jgi:hypothetical protein